MHAGVVKVPTKRPLHRHHLHRVQAATMVDSVNRLFLRSLRTGRGLRRYAPSVTVQNAAQNIGGQQVNVAREAHAWT